MSHITDLQTLLKKDVLVEVSENIAEIEKAITETKKKNELKDLNADLEYMRQVEQYFNEVLADIENKSLTQEQALDILEGLEDMRADNQEV